MTQKTKTPDSAKIRRKPTQSRAIETKARLLEAAHDILTKEGLDALTTRRLATVSGLSVGSIYVYFPNLEALLFYVFEQRLWARLAVFDEVFDAPDPNLSGRDHVNAYFRLMADRHMWSKLDLELKNAEEKFPALKSHTQWFEDELTARYIKQWKRLGSDWRDADLKLLAAYAHNLDHINLKMQMEKTRAQRKQIGEITSELFHALTRMTGAKYD